MSVNALGANIARKIWAVIVIILMLLAIYVSIGRVVMPRLENYQPQIEQALSEALGVQVSSHKLQGGWLDFSPVVTLEQVKFSQPDEETQPVTKSTIVEVDQLALRLDVLSSLLSRQIILHSFTLQGMKLELNEFEKGRWRLGNLSEHPHASNVNPVNWLLLQKEMLLSDISLTLHPQKSDPRTLKIPEWGLRCGLMVCASQGSVTWQSESDNELTFSLNIYERPGDENFRVEGYAATAPVQVMDWLALLKTDVSLINNIKSLLVGGNVWFDWQGGRLQDARGSLNISQIELGNQHEAMAAIDFLQTDFAWLRDTDIDNELWALWLSDLTFKYADKVFEPGHRRLSLLQQDKGLVARLVADRLELEPIVSTVLALQGLPDEVRTALSTLQPRGELRNLHLDYLLPNADQPDTKPWFKMEGLLDNVSVSPWQHAPGGSGISGYLQVLPDSGIVDFVSDDFQLYFPLVFSDSWKFYHASGEVSWIYKEHTLWLNGQHLRLSGDVGNINGSFRTLISDDAIEPRLSLLLSLQDARLPDALTFVPDVIASSQLTQWLDQAFASGQVSSTRLVLDQALTQDADPSTQTLAIDIDATAVDFSFQPDWPPLTDASVNVQIRDQAVFVQASKARFFTLDLQHVDAHYRGQGESARLTVSADVSGPLSDGWRVLTDTPLRKNLFNLSKDFQLSGLMAGQLSLDLPFATPKESVVKLAFDTREAGLTIPSLGVELDAITGEFDYSTRQGLNASGVSATMFGYPARVTIASKDTSQGLATELQMHGHLNTTSLKPWVPAALLSRLPGETDFQADLSVGKASQNNLVINSDLKGIAVQLPAPLAKTAKKPSNFVFKLPLAGPQIHQLSYDDKFSYMLRFAERGYRDGQIQVGSAKPRYTGGSSIQVMGVVPMLDYQKWLDTFKQMQQEGGGTTVSTESNDSLIRRIGSVELQAKTFRFFNKNYQQVVFKATQQKGDWKIHFDNSLAQGELSYFSDARKPLAAELNYLYLPDDKAIDKNDLTAVEYNRRQLAASDMLASVKPQELPALDVNIKALHLGNKPFGHWAFKLRPHSEGASLQELNFDLRGIQARGQLDWTLRRGQHSSYFSGALLIPDVAAMLQAWEKAPAIKAKNVTLKGRLSWNGSPARFSPLIIQGPLSLKAKQGRVVDLQSIRLLGVLNFHTLSRRLRLDFSDLFKKGFSFDRAEGKLQFENGHMLMNESLIIDGPSAKFKIDGSTDLINERFDQDVIVVLPVTENLPVIATLAGFPQVGVPMYLFNRAFGDVFDRFSSVNYRVTGSWDDPDIKLDSFFDSQDVTKTPDRSPKRRGKR